MTLKKTANYNFGADVSASIVVLLVALPLCLGIALASGAPLFSGIIAGIIGGIFVGFFSGSNLSVSGPAAGLTVIVANGIKELQVYEVFLMAVVIAGVFQIILGWVKAGVVGDFIPNAVIKGMLAAIGIILILKQIPHFVGYDANFEGDESFFQSDNENTFSELLKAIKFISPLAVIIALLAVVILIIWEKPFIKKIKIFQFVPGPLMVVVMGIVVNEFIKGIYPMYAVQDKHLVKLPVATSVDGFLQQFTFPKLDAILNYKVWKVAFTLAMVASIETLLGIEAVDKLDTQKRITPTNKELVAQGIGNMLSGAIGGLPLTSVIVRSSANANAGAKTKWSAILHGIFLLLSVILIPSVLNKIPLSVLAAILIFTGYKLAKVALFKEFYKKGFDQFIPFVVTIVAILFTDLLVGIVIGVAVAVVFVLQKNLQSAILVVKENDNYLVRLKKDVSFFNKSIVKKQLEQIPANTYVLIDATRANFIDKDVIDELNNFIEGAAFKNITIEIKKNEFNKLHDLIKTV
jgi:MFS superfamily sulfate permease-like transporter